MKLKLLAVGERMPDWVRGASHDYLTRLQRWQAVQLVEIAPGARGQRGASRTAIDEEGRRILAAVPAGTRIVALDLRGQHWSSTKLAEQLADWRMQGRDVALVIGGADGLADEVLERAEQRWSLGPLTLPHALVRVIVLEQLYRAASLLAGHPYHRA